MAYRKPISLSTLKDTSRIMFATLLSSANLNTIFPATCVKLKFLHHPFAASPFAFSYALGTCLANSRWMVFNQCSKGANNSPMESSSPQSPEDTVEESKQGRPMRGKIPDNFPLDPRLRQLDQEAHQAQKAARETHGSRTDAASHSTSLHNDSEPTGNVQKAKSSGRSRPLVQVIIPKPHNQPALSGHIPSLAPAIADRSHVSAAGSPKSLENSYTATEGIASGSSAKLGTSHQPVTAARERLRERLRKRLMSPSPSTSSSSSSSSESPPSTKKDGPKIHDPSADTTKLQAKKRRMPSAKDPSSNAAGAIRQLPVRRYLYQPPHQNDPPAQGPAPWLYTQPGPSSRDPRRPADQVQTPNKPNNHHPNPFLNCLPPGHPHLDPHGGQLPPGSCVEDQRRFYQASDFITGLLGTAADIPIPQHHGGTVNWCITHPQDPCKPLDHKYAVCAACCVAAKQHITRTRPYLLKTLYWPLCRACGNDAWGAVVEEHQKRTSPPAPAPAPAALMGCRCQAAWLCQECRVAALERSHARALGEAEVRCMLDGRCRCGADVCDGQKRWLVCAGCEGLVQGPWGPEEWTRRLNWLRKFGGTWT